jgi:predicted amidohydrolase
MYAPGKNGILDEQGRLFPDVTTARRRGIIFDFGNGVGGHRGESHETGFLAGHLLDRLEPDVENDRRRRFPERDVEVHQHPSPGVICSPANPCL